MSFHNENQTLMQEELDATRNDFVIGIAFVCSVLFVSVIFLELLKKFPFPFTAAMFFSGCIVGVIDRYALKSWIMIRLMRPGPRLLMHVFLPAIIYESAFSMDPHMFTTARAQCLILAVPGLIISTGLIACYAKLMISPLDWNWTICLTVGAILSSTDPTAVVPLLKESGITLTLQTLIEGESLINKATAAILFKTFLQIFGEEQVDPSRVVWNLLYRIAVSPFIGYLMAVGAIAFLKIVDLDHEAEATITLCAAYFTYFFCEVTIGASGVLAIVVLGLCVASYKGSLQHKYSDNVVHQFWQALSLWSNSLIFTIAGILIVSYRHPHIMVHDVSSMISTYVGVTVIRCLMMAIVGPFLKSRGFGFSWNYGVVLAWSGLRGAVGMALVITTQNSLPVDLYNEVFYQVSCVIISTLVVNASTMGLLLELLGITRTKAENLRGMKRAVALLRDAARATESAAKMGKFFPGVDWTWVGNVTRVSNPYENVKSMDPRIYHRFDADRGQCPKCLEEIEIEPNEEEVEGLEEESRQQVLKALESSTLNKHQGYQISRRTLSHLCTIVETTIDEPGKYIDGEDVDEAYLTISNITKLMRKLMYKLLSVFNIGDTDERDEFAHGSISREDKKNAFRRWCFSTFVSPRFNILLYWTLILNAFPIVAEVVVLVLYAKHRHSKEDFESAIVVMEIVNGVLALIYIVDVIAGICGLGCRRYFRATRNKLDFLSTLSAVTQIVLGIVIFTAYRYSYSLTLIYVLVGIGSFRILRLLRLTLRGILLHLMNEVCSVIFNAYDFAVGFIITHEEVAKTVHDVVEYQPCAKIVQCAAEDNIAKVLSSLEDLDKDYPDIANAWKTHRAAIYVLCDMKRIIEYMLSIYTLDEADAQILLRDIEIKIKSILNEPKYMPTNRNVEALIKTIPWAKSEEVLSFLVRKHQKKRFSTGDIIKYAGKKSQSIAVIASGIVQVMGTNIGVKDNILPNTDSLWCFLKTGSFCEYMKSPELIGTLGYLLKTESSTQSACSKESELVLISYDDLEEAEASFGDFAFLMWRYVAVQITQIVLEDEDNYKYWPPELIKIHIEEGILPDLRGLGEFDVPPAIWDMVLVQGRAVEKESRVEYVGPAYIPSGVVTLELPDDPDTRPRVVMVLLRDGKYHSRFIMDWTELKDIGLSTYCWVHGMENVNTLKPLEEEISNEYLPRNQNDQIRMLP